MNHFSLPPSLPPSLSLSLSHSPSLSLVDLLPVLGVSQKLLVDTMNEDGLISEEGDSVAILQGQLPQITGSWGPQLAVAEEEPH